MTHEPARQTVLFCAQNNRGSKVEILDFQPHHSETLRQIGGLRSFPDLDTVFNLSDHRNNRTGR